ncbi:uncharacterized protein BDZ99DRAFT_386582, partial [Mytilinidion resinicola]
LIETTISLFKSADYSDFRIICGSDTHNVHRAIVFPRSEVFAASFRFGGKEAENAEMTLHDDEPEHVKALVYYFYHLDYSVSNATPREPMSNKAQEPLLQMDAAPPSWDDFDVNTRSDYQRRPIYPLFPHPPTQQLSYGGSKKTKRITRARESQDFPKPLEGFPCLVFHAKMYALADKYNVKGLKLLAQERFTAAVETGWTHEEFPAATRVVFETTLDTDVGLREPLVKVLLEHSALLDQPEVEAVVKDIPGLAYDLLKRHRSGDSVSRLGGRY